MLYNDPKLSVVGAGPGDPELITIKAVNTLKAADVVLYDALINRELLNYAPQAELVYVGKRKDQHKYSQEQINQLIVKYAKERGHVVRLKGGDPFIFGRGMEELEYAKSNGLKTAVVSGVTSSIGVPASVGVSLTQRGVSESIWIITGTTSERKLSKDVLLAAQSSATVVILMGMSKLKEIVSTFSHFGKQELPVAIVQNGTTTSEKSVFGRLRTIESIALENEISTPATIVIGEVVGQRHRFQRVLENLETTAVETHYNIPV